MPCNAVCGLPGSTIFFHVSHNRYGFLKKVTEHRMQVLIFSSTFPETFLMVTSIKQDIIINIHIPAYKVSVILVRF